MTVVGKLASLAIPYDATGGPLGTQTRRLYHPAGLVQVSGTLLSDAIPFDLVPMGSSSRPDPMNRVVRNSCYALRGRATAELKDDDGNGLVGSDAPLSSLTTPETLDVPGNPLQGSPAGRFADQSAADTTVPMLHTAGGVVH